MGAGGGVRSLFMIIYIVYLLVLVYVLNGVRNLVSSFDFLRQRQVSLNKNHFNIGKIKICILIPVLREQEVIRSNLKIFTNLNGDYELIYITTEKENFEKKSGFARLQSRKNIILQTKSQDFFVENLVGLFPKSISTELFHSHRQFADTEKFWSHLVQKYKELPTTSQIITHFLQSNREECSYAQILHYPNRDGLMAHQLNYACEVLLKDHDSQSTFVLVYNADSSVGQDVLDIFIREIQKGERVIFQPSLFLANYQNFSSNFRGWILKCIALAQSRWTLIHEIPRIRAQYKQDWHTIYESAHLVGHGTCVRLDTLMSVGGFPDQFLNEDLALGYFLALRGERISIVPILENAESPSSVSSVINQYTTWFYGAMDYVSYYKHAVQVLSLPKFKALTWAGVNIVRAGIWLLAPWIWMILILVPLFQDTPLLSFISLLTFLFYTIFVYWLIARFVSDNPEILEEKTFSVHVDKGMIFATPVAYVIWGIGPTRAFIQKFFAAVLGKNVQKKKTER